METKRINLTAIQLGSKLGDKKYNFNRVSEIFSKIKNTDIVVLPEVWNIGWACENFQHSAENIENSETLAFLSELAKSYQLNIIGGSIILKVGGKFYNSTPVINRKGDLVAIYNKNHLYSYYGDNESKYISVGENPVIIELEQIKFGLSICYDIRFPEIYRAYRFAGADVLINCAAWSYLKPIPWEMMTKSRAIENQTYFIAVNQFGKIKNDDFNLGHSRIIDYNGNVLSEILTGEGFIQAELDMNKMYEFREKCKLLSDIKPNYEVKMYA